MRSLIWNVIIHVSENADTKEGYTEEAVKGK